MRLVPRLLPGLSSSRSWQFGVPRAPCYRTMEGQPDQMFEHSCKKAGAGGCGFKASAGSENELRAVLTEHVKKRHNVNGMTDTIYNYLRAVSAR